MKNIKSKKGGYLDLYKDYRNIQDFILADPNSSLETIISEFNDQVKSSNILYAEFKVILDIYKNINKENIRGSGIIDQINTFKNDHDGNFALEDLPDTSQIPEITKALAEIDNQFKKEYTWGFDTYLKIIGAQTNTAPALPVPAEPAPAGPAPVEPAPEPPAPEPPAPEPQPPPAQRQIHKTRGKENKAKSYHFPGTANPDKDLVSLETYLEEEVKKSKGEKLERAKADLEEFKKNGNINLNRKGGEYEHNEEDEENEEEDKEEHENNEHEHEKEHEEDYNKKKLAGFFKYFEDSSDDELLK